METLNLIKNDPWLEPFEDAIKGRHQHVLDKEAELTNKGKQTLSDFASGYLYFGLHRTADGWIFREWAPNATEIFIVGTFNEWKELKKYSLKRKDYGVWEIKLPADAMRHGDLYKLIVHWEGGCGERIPAWATRVVQDEQTKIFSAQVWSPEKPYKVKKRTFKPNTDPLLIYECHIGMAQQEDKVGTYNEFREKTLPRIAKAGYNCIQIMAIQEHPYYGSFGYHVSSFFAASSRFGTPEELKELIDTAHGLGIAVIMDIVHSHAVKNEVEGLGNFAGDPNQYFYPGARREHPAWDSLCFDYGKNEVIHFLLSNCKYWLEEYGFERLCMALQGKTSNYDTDVFQPMLKAIAAMSGTEYGKDKQQDIAMRVIADHIRTIAFSITDGQLPSNAKAGYVIRRILRRAVRYGYTFLGQKQAFMYKLLPVLIDNMGEAYPELVAQKTLIEKVIKEEEESFLRTLETGIRLLDKTMEDTKANGKTEISGKDAFTLYDTFGFPLDLTELILRENGMTVNIEEFNEEMQQQKQRARNAAAIETGDWIVLKEGTTEFVGYDYTEYEASILRYRQIKQKNQTLYQIVLDYTPFYAESGGQVGDTGVLVSEFETIEVVDTKKENNLPIHITKKLPEHPEAPMMACVDTDKRAACAANHSATHLLDAALREVLGEHIEQKGSLVTPDSLRFDFSHFQKVTDEEIRKVEHIVNARIRANIPLKEYRNIPIEEAKELGAIALFGEKYGDRVRVIQFGTSIEFCGGTHVAATGNIGMVKIISESSVAAGVRRIEAYTGARVEEMLDTIQDTLSDLKALFNNAPDLRIAIRKYLDENAGLKKQVEDFMKEKEAALKERLLKNVQEIHGIKVIKFCAPLPAEVVKNIAFQLRGEITENLFFVAGSTDNGKPMLTVMLSDNLVAGGLKAGNLVKEAAKLIQGGGGGQPHFATAGGKNADGLPAAVEKVLELAGI